MRTACSVLRLTLGLAMLGAQVACAADEGVKFSMRNLAGESVRVYWVGFDGGLVPQTTNAVKNSSSVSINSYRSHRFLVWYARARDENAIQAEAKEKGKQYTVRSFGGALVRGRRRLWRRCVPVCPAASAWTRS